VKKVVSWRRCPFRLVQILFPERTLVLPLGEQRPQHRVGQRLGIEQLLQAMQPLGAARVLVERLLQAGMLSRTFAGSSQEAGPPPVEAVGEPVAIDGVQARDVIVDVMDVQRD
jgi:hypothetical protein